jgi:predicted nuclease of restriction endonuclease-like (RecB) superfamily
MSKLITIDNEYKEWLSDIKIRIKQSQLKASIRVNTEMLELYWSIGSDIVELQAESKWGTGVVPQLSKDLSKAFPDAQGFSERNLVYMTQFYRFYHATLIPKQAVAELGKDDQKQFPQQPVAELNESTNDLQAPQQLCMMVPWGQNILIFTKSKSPEEAIFYLQQTIQNGWSRSELTKQIKDNLYHKRGASPNNFETTLPDLQSAIATEMTRDPYNFDFAAAALRDGYKEKELEDALTKNITDFLIELGQGFAYMGRQIKLTVGKKTFKLDLLFYNVKLHCYIAIDLKTGVFDSKDIGQLGLYVSAVNHIMKADEDKPTVGLLICKEKDNTVARYSLESSAHPIGISEYELANLIPEDYKSALPSVKEIEEELND